MSTSLIKKSLALLTYETDVTKDKSKKKKTKSSGILDLIPVNHRLVTKDKKKGSKLVLQRSSKVTIYDAQKQLRSKVDPTEENVKRLLLLSGNRLNTETSEKLLTRATKKRYVIKEEKPVAEESTAFTEEDFKKFEADYVAE